MSELYAIFSFSLLTAALVFPLLSRTMTPRNAAVLAVVIGFAISLVPRHSDFNLLMVSLLSPLPVLIPVYALGLLAGPFGFRPGWWPRADLAVALVALLTLILSAIGHIGFDIYRYGYEAWPVAIIAAGMAALALWRNHMLLLVGIVLGQILWMLEIGSTNFFDHVSHILLIPLLGLYILKRRQTNERGD